MQTLDLPLFEVLGHVLNLKGASYDLDSNVGTDIRAVGRLDSIGISWVDVS